MDPARSRPGGVLVFSYERRCPLSQGGNGHPKPSVCLQSTPWLLHQIVEVSNFTSDGVGCCSAALTLPT